MIGKMIKVSVIIPVYNTEKYIKKTLQCICNQTLQEIEIIVINDGSTDHSLNLINQIQKKDSRIKVFSQDNQGPSISRNNGLLKAQGEYIYFMDSDDLLEEKTLETCYHTCEANNLDFVFFDAETFQEDSINRSLALSYKHTKGLTQRIYSGLEAYQKQLQDKTFTASVCLNCIKREFLNQNQLDFYPHILHEDQLFIGKLYIFSQKTMGIEKAFFKRRLRSESIMTSTFKWKNVSSYFKVTQELLIFKKDKSLEEQKAIDTHLSQMLDSVVWQGHTLPIKERLNLFLIVLFKYKRYIQCRTLVVLLIKKYLPHSNK